MSDGVDLMSYPEGETRKVLKQFALNGKQTGALTISVNREKDPNAKVEASVEKHNTCKFPKIKDFIKNLEHSAESFVGTYRFMWVDKSFKDDS
jgi:hypothetical protein